MPKLKTKKGVAKRFKLTKKGGLKYHTGGKSHLATAKTTKKLRCLRRARTLKDNKKIKYLKRLLPYG